MCIDKIENIIGAKNEELISLSKYLDIVEKTKEERLADAGGFLKHIGDDCYQVIFSIYKLLGWDRNTENLKERILSLAEKRIIKSKEELKECIHDFNVCEKYYLKDKFLGYGQRGIDKAKELNVSYYSTCTYGDDRFEFGGSLDTEIYTKDIQTKEVSNLYKMREKSVKSKKDNLKEFEEYFYKLKNNLPVIKVYINKRYV